MCVNSSSFFPPCVIFLRSLCLVCVACKCCLPLIFLLPIYPDLLSHTLLVVHIEDTYVMSSCLLSGVFYVFSVPRPFGRFLSWVSVLFSLILYGFFFLFINCVPSLMFRCGFFQTVSLLPCSACDPLSFGEILDLIPCDLYLRPAVRGM